MNKELGRVIEIHLKTLQMLPESEIDMEQQAYLKHKNQVAKANSESGNKSVNEQDKANNTLNSPDTARSCSKCYQKSVV